VIAARTQVHRRPPITGHDRYIPRRRRARCEHPASRAAGRVPRRGRLRA
jgi:hypothetical protein